MKDKVMDALQRFSKAMFIPVLILPIAGILIAVGNLFTNPRLQAVLPFLNNPVTIGFGTLLSGSLNAILTNLGVIFCVGLSVGLANKKKSEAGFISLLAFLVFLNAMNKFMNMRGMLVEGSLSGTGQAMVLGVQVLDMGVFIGLLLGIVVALLRMSRVKLLKVLAGAYIEFLRGTPLLVQVLIVFYGLPQMGVKLPRMTAGTVALVINSAAYMAEIVRSGIQAIDGGQTEASRSLGMNGAQTMIYIILPQAIKNILPAIGNEFVSIIKESSILYTIGIYELTYQANKLASTNFRYLETLTISALIYFVLTFTASRLLGMLERRMRRGDR